MRSSVGLERCTVTAEVASSSLVVSAIIKKIFGELAQLARAPALHAGGQEFDSPILHQINNNAECKVQNI